MNQSGPRNYKKRKHVFCSCEKIGQTLSYQRLFSVPKPHYCTSSIFMSIMQKQIKYCLYLTVHFVWIVRKSDTLFAVESSTVVYDKHPLDNTEVITIPNIIIYLVGFIINRGHIFDMK